MIDLFTESELGQLAKAMLRVLEAAGAMHQSSGQQHASCACQPAMSPQSEAGVSLPELGGIAPCVVLARRWNRHCKLRAGKTWRHQMGPPQYARCQCIYAHVGLLSRLPGLEPPLGQPR